jgi:hypothetical protein
MSRAVVERKRKVSERAYRQEEEDGGRYGNDVV